MERDLTWNDDWSTEHEKDWTRKRRLNIDFPLRQRHLLQFFDYRSYLLRKEAFRRRSIIYIVKIKRCGELSSSMWFVRLSFPLSPPLFPSRRFSECDWISVTVSRAFRATMKQVSFGLSLSLWLSLSLNSVEQKWNHLNRPIQCRRHNPIVKMLPPDWSKTEPRHYSKIKRRRRGG